MADTKEGREKQADAESRRQQERDMAAAQERKDEIEPPIEQPGEATSDPGECRRRGCNDPAEFHVLERYQEETGQGTVEATARLCQVHAAEESPVNLDSAGPDYVFRVTPITES